MRLAVPALALALPGCAALIPLAVPLAEVAIKGAVAAYQVHQEVKPLPAPSAATEDHPSMAEMPTPP